MQRHRSIYLLCEYKKIDIISSHENAQRNLTKNGEQLLAALNFFVSSVNTIVNKTMEDSISTVRQYEVSRVEYDAYRSDLEYYATAPKTEVKSVQIIVPTVCIKLLELSK